jgi:release factor glutamine methyltransferase
MNNVTKAPGAAEPWTIKRLLDWTTTFLAQKGAETPLLDTQVLLSHALGCKKIDLYTRHDDIVSEVDRATFRDLIRRRIEGCPVAYLVGRKEFFSLELEVGPAVLIPRPDTETVVDECLRQAKGMTEPEVLDIGTGSGCLAVAVARQHRTARVTAIDISGDALAVAVRNAARHDVGNRIRFLQGDVYTPLAMAERFDFILSNPPYIRHADLATLMPGVRDYEPHIALDGGDDGFAVFDRIVAELPTRLRPGGHVFLEIGTAQEEPGRYRLSRIPGLELARTVYDGSGHPRVLHARKVG